MGHSRVLFLRYDRIGDMVISTGILSTLGEHYPNLRIDVLASWVNQSVISNEPYVQDTLTYNVKNPFHLLLLAFRLRA